MNNDTQIITHKVFTLFVHHLYEIMRMKKKIIIVTVFYKYYNLLHV